MKGQKGTLLTALGLLLIAAALSLTGHNLWEEQRAAQSAETVVERLAVPLSTEDRPIVPASKDGGNASHDETGPGESAPSGEPELPVRAVEGRDYIGVLSIPSLGLELPVLSRWSDAGLKTAPCRYSGSPEEGGFVIAGHNYRAHFGGLKTLREGDALLFTGADGKEYAYQVVLCETVESTDIEGMTGGGWDLTLFTCTVGGRSRVAVRCGRESG